MSYDSRNDSRNIRTDTRTATHLLPVAKILHGQHVCLRAALDMEAIDDLSEALQEGAEVQAPLVYHDGQRYWLADGERTLRARSKLGEQHVGCEVRRGSHADALVAGLNRHRSQLGLFWRRADRRHAAMLLLSDPVTRAWSNVRLAELAGYKDEKSVRLLRSLTEDQEAARKEQESRKQVPPRPISENSEVVVKPAPKTFKDDEPAKPHVETRTVERKDGSTYQLPIRPRKALPRRKDTARARRQLLRTVTKLERQVDDGELDLALVYERLLEGARKGMSGRRTLEELYAVA